MWLSFIYAQRYQRAQWMSPLDDYVAKAGADWDFNDLLSGAVTPLRAEGKLWAIPVFADSTMVVYRKDILEKAGVKEFPKTYADMEAMLKQIHNKDGVAAFAIPTFPAMGQMGFYVPAFIQAFGGEQYKDIAKGDYTPNYESPEVIEGVETFARWVKDFSPPGGASVQGTGVVTMMSAGKAAVCILSTGAVGRIMDPTASQLTDKFAFASWPKAKVQAAAAAFHGLMIPASAKDKDLAWEFIKWGSSKEILKRTAMNKSYPGVTRQSVFNDPEFKKKYDWGSGDFARIYAESINLADMRYRTLAFASPIGDELSKSVSAVIAGQKTTAQAMKEMNAKAREIITGEGFKLS
jgi:ABC-type glycerol-3-phosphate transport system substrate-binding protein